VRKRAEDARRQSPVASHRGSSRSREHHHHLAAQRQPLQRLRGTLQGIVVETSTLPIEDKEKARATLKRKGITCSTARSPAPARRRRPRTWSSSPAGTESVLQKPPLPGFPGRTTISARSATAAA
jgi:hypothetical protein